MLTIIMMNKLYASVEDFKHNFQEQLLHDAEAMFYEEPQIVCNEFKLLAEAVLTYYGMNPSNPSSFLEALEVYFCIVHTLDSMFDYYEY